MTNFFAILFKMILLLLKGYFTFWLGRRNLESWRFTFNTSVHFLKFSMMMGWLWPVIFIAVNKKQTKSQTCKKDVVSCYVKSTQRVHYILLFWTILHIFCYMKLIMPELLILKSHKILPSSIRRKEASMS